jgi:Ferric reductase like transmembrane component
VSSQALWYLTRASGVVALVLLTATTLLGVLSAHRWRSERWPRFAVATLHRNLTLLALVFVGTHVATTVADAYAPVGVRDAFVPFASAYRPVWVGFGALTFDLLLALTVTSMLRRHIGYRTWRAIHWASYAAWPLAVAHGFGSGSDARFGWMATLTFACIAVVLGGIAVRLVGVRSPQIQLGGGAAAVVVVVVLAAWYHSGPAQHGWAARAGTPTSLLKTTAVPAQRRRVLASTQTVAVGPFTGRLVGRMSQSADEAGDAAVAIAAAVRGSRPALLNMTLWGTAAEGGGLLMSRSDVSLRDAATGAVSTGQIVALDGNRVVADVISSSGTRLRLSMVLQIDPAAGTVGGTLHGSPRSGSDE